MPGSRKVLACATVMEEILPLLPANVAYQTLDFGLHINPANLKHALQDAIDASAGIYDEIILGYGFCSMAVMGLRANGCTLVVPRVDDCIAISLGSGHAYKQQARAEPGTYYLTKGWIEVADTPFDEYDRLAEKYGPQKADWLIRQTIKHYTRLALIDTGQHDTERYRDHVRKLAERWSLRFEEIPGSNTLVRQMIFGPWDDSFVVVPPGQSIRYEHFFPAALCRPHISYEEVYDDNRCSAFAGTTGDALVALAAPGSRRTATGDPHVDSTWRHNAGAHRVPWLVLADRRRSRDRGHLCG